MEGQRFFLSLLGLDGFQLEIIRMSKRHILVWGILFPYRVKVLKRYSVNIFKGKKASDKP